MKMVVVKNFPNRMYAEQAKQSLEAEGIQSLIQSQFTGMVGLDSTGTLPTSAGVDLCVSEEFAKKAKEILTALFDGI